MTLLQPVLIALTGGAAIFLLMFSFFPSRSPLAMRIEAMQQVTERDHYDRQARFARIFGGENTGALQARLIEAGWYRITPTGFSIRGLAGLAFGACVGLALAMIFPNKSIGLCVGVMTALICWRYPKIALDRAIKKRKAAIERALPDFLDMLASTVQAGLALNAAIIQSAETSLGPLKSELQSMLAEIRLGRPRSEALTSMAERINDPQITTMVTAIVQAEHLGSNVSSMLKELAVDTRHLRWSLAEERAAKLPIKMMIPMGLLMLPSLYIMIFGPVAAKLVAVFGK
jgi:tight adherence protein C